MKQTIINLKCDTVKYKALEYYLSKQNKTIEKELQKFLEDLYGEQVPEPVREYIKSQNPELETQNQPEQNTERIPPRRRSNRNRMEQSSSEELTHIEPDLSM